MSVEQLQMVKLLAALLLLVGVAWLYALGGREEGPGKWVRRYVAGLLLPIGTLSLAVWSGTVVEIMLLSLPLFPVAFSQGYGGNTTSEKMRQRAGYALWVWAAQLPIYVSLGEWTLAALQLVNALLVNVTLGVKNPTPAPVEEGTICFLSTVLMPMSVIV